MSFFNSRESHHIVKVSQILQKARQPRALFSFNAVTDLNQK